MSLRDHFRFSPGPRGREWIVFVLSIILACLVWFLVNLSDKYTGVISVPVVAQCNIEGYGNESSNTVLVSARCRTEGFRLVREYSRRERKVVKVKFNKADLRRTAPGEYCVIGGAKNSYINQFFGDDAQLEAFITDTLRFVFPVENHKKVPVDVPLNFVCRSQYMPSGPFRITPDSVTVYGSQDKLDAVEKVTTNRLFLSEVDSPQHGLLKLNPIKGVRMSADEVSYELPVSRYLEVSATVNLEVLNVPAGSSLQVYPPTATVYLRCAFPIGKDPLKSFRLYIDWKDFTSSLNGRCVPCVVRLPSGVLDYRVEPEVFDCIEVH